jgi:hypothetical protein
LNTGMKFPDPCLWKTRISCPSESETTTVVPAEFTQISLGTTIPPDTAGAPPDPLKEVMRE